MQEAGRGMGIFIAWKSLEEDFASFFVEKIGQPAKPVRLVVARVRKLRVP
ncbi:MAG TPA: hypothetical protein VIH61_00365 [Waddliaceae bacterium]